MGVCVFTGEGHHRESDLLQSDQHEQWAAYCGAGGGHLTRGRLDGEKGKEVGGLLIVGGSCPKKRPGSTACFRVGG